MIPSYKFALAFSNYFDLLYLLVELVILLHLLFPLSLFPHLLLSLNRLHVFDPLQLIKLVKESHTGLLRGRCHALLLRY
jgi:hypothetical protein